MESRFNTENGKYDEVLRSLEEELLRGKINRKPKKKPSESDDDNWSSNLLEMHPGCKIEEGEIKKKGVWQWVAKTDKPGFDPSTVNPINPETEYEEDIPIFRTAIYAHIEGMYVLRDYAIMLLAVSCKRTIDYIMWRARCHIMYLNNADLMDSFLAGPCMTEEACRGEIRKSSHARIKPSSAAENGKGVAVQSQPPRRCGLDITE